MAPFVWKQLSGENISWYQDFTTVDAAEVSQSLLYYLMLTDFILASLHFVAFLMNPVSLSTSVHSLDSLMIVLENNFLSLKLQLNSMEKKKKKKINIFLFGYNVCKKPEIGGKKKVCLALLRLSISVTP